MNFFRRNRDEQQPVAQPLPPQLPTLTKPFGERMQEELERVRWEAHGAGKRLPVAALPLLGRVEDVLAPLLAHLVANPPSVDEEIAVQGIVADYLPTTLRAFIGLPAHVSTTIRDNGTTPADDLLEQLRTLESAASDLSRAVYAHDVDKLQAQGRFLDTKFSRSDLSL